MVSHDCDKKSITRHVTLSYFGWGEWPNFTENSLWTWGNNVYGQLGDGTVIRKSSPVQVPGTEWSSNVARGGYHTAAIKTDGTLWVCGDNSQGQLGDGHASIARSSPYQVAGLRARVAEYVGVKNQWHPVGMGRQLQRPVV